VRTRRLFPLGGCPSLLVCYGVHPLDPVAAATLQSWAFQPWLTLALLVSVAVYLRGWRLVRLQMPQRFPAWRAAAFCGGLLVIFIAAASPLDALGGLLLQVHMTQHLLLTMVGPPLIWLGAPSTPLLRGLPRVLRKQALGPFLASPALRRLGGWIGHPLICWPSFVLTMWLWHVPALYELALRAPSWHVFEHACFVTTALLFWWPVVQPWPSRPAWPRWAMIPYLLLADVQNTIFSALFAFYERVIYPSYALAPRLWGVSALSDQAAAGAVMWVPSAVIYLIPVGWIITELLGPHPTLASWPFPLLSETVRELPRPSINRQGNGAARHDQRGCPRDEPSGCPARPQGNEAARYDAGGGPRARDGRDDKSGWPPKPYANWVATRTPDPVSGRIEGSPGTQWDLLAAPLIGRIIAWPYFRRTTQAIMLLVGTAVVADGLLGPPMSPMNLAGVLPWTYWRGFAVIALLAAGNLFCMACPFMLPRDLGRRLLPARWRWPRQLRSKWLAVAILLTYLWAYEAFSLWNSPRATAWVIIGYFAAALAVDGLFRGASFCKYVCPIGQFHFIHSLVSPLEIKVRNADACRTCRTYDCIRGNGQQRGCELNLFQPRKVGNFDCTFCLDCVHACPHDNVGMLVVPPGADLVRDPYRSSIRRWSRRPDIAGLALLLVGGAFVNAAAMTAPVAALEKAVAAQLAEASTLPVFTTLLLAALVVAVPLLSAICGLAGRILSGIRIPWLELTCRFAMSLVPLGFSMWCAHFLFHLLSSARSALPVVQRAVRDIGWDALGSPAWVMSGAGTPSDWLLQLEMLLLDAGLLLTLYVAWRIAVGYTRRGLRPLGLVLPWVGLATGLYAVGIWVLFQPMQMRGMMMH
jgi:cytochrome c oxidase assembly factor CtaG